VCAEGIRELPQRGVASSTHLRDSFFKTWGGGFPSTSRVVSAPLVHRKGSEGGTLGRSSSRASCSNLAIHLPVPSTTFVAGYLRQDHCDSAGTHDPSW